MPMLSKPTRKLTVVVDVSCDYANQFNPIAIYHDKTTFDKPTNAVILSNNDIASKTKPLDVIAIDNLPSMLPVESSNDFASKLYPYLLELADFDNSTVWMRSLDKFFEAIEEANKI